MTVMKQAIAGKDSEQFLGDQGAEKAPLLQAKAELAKPGGQVGVTVQAKPIIKPALGPGR